MRVLALEFLVTIAEASPAMCRKIGEGDIAGTPCGLPDRRSSNPSGARAGGGVGYIPGQDTFAGTVIPVCFVMMTELQVISAQRFHKMDGGAGFTGMLFVVECWLVIRGGARNF